MELAERAELESLRRLEALEAKARGAKPEPPKGPDPTEGMTPGELSDAGWGKATMDIWRTGKRAANAIGIGDYDEAAAAEDARLDKPLMATGWGKAANIGGTVANTALPLARGAQLGTQAVAKVLPNALKGIAPYVGAVPAGAAVGAATSPESPGTGAAWGAALAPAGELLGRTAQAVYQGGKALIEPLWGAGRERILKRTLERFSGKSADELSRTAAAAPEYVKGVKPTAAEATMDPGIAQLQRSSAALSPDVSNALQAARDRQLTAYRAELERLAGAGGRYEGAVAKRGAQADALYGTARQAGLDPAADPLLQGLLSRPAIQQAQSSAVTNAANRGATMGPAGSVEGLQQMKMALDSQISKAKIAGDTDAVRSLMKAQEDLLAYLDAASPWHNIARQEFAKASGPINQMDIAQALRNKALPALTDTQGVPSRVNANSYAQALREGDQTARKATGFPGATMEGTMTKTQMGTLRGIEQDMARHASAADMGGIAGSRTAQHMEAANIVEQMLGPLGFPRGVADMMIGRLAGGIMGLPYRFSQTQTQQLLAKALTDPATLQRVLAAKDPQTVAALLQPYAAPLVTQGATGSK